MDVEHVDDGQRHGRSGRLRIDPPLCRAGDALTIRLERDCLVAVSVG